GQGEGERIALPSGMSWLARNASVPPFMDSCFPQLPNPGFTRSTTKMNTRSHLIHERRWRGQRFEPSARREEGESLFGLRPTSNEADGPKIGRFRVSCPV